MTKRDAGIEAEDRAWRQEAGALLIGLLDPDHEKTLKTIAVELELPENKLIDISRQKTRKRWKKNKDTGAKQELVETEPGVVDETDFAFIAGKGYNKGRGKIPDQIVFEFGLGQLVELVHIQRGSGLTDKEEAAIDEKAKAEVRALLSNRHEAHKLFTTDGLDRIRRGYLPGKRRNGSPKRWHKASPEVRLAAFDGWLNEIAALGCRVFERETWNDWFRTANASSNMEQSAWRYYDHLEIDGWEICSLPCPPDWILGVDTEYFGAFDALDSDELLNSLLLVTEGDMPYSLYHKRHVQPKLELSCGGPQHVRRVDADGWEAESYGDDLGVWAADRMARTAQSEAEATALIDRARGRKNGGARL
jgi:hypothetical protein